MHAFLGERGFLVVPICESLNFDFSADLQTATDNALQRARDLIKAKHADLLLFGDVRERDKAVTIYAMNEHGGCDLRPKPTLIEHGDLPDAFNTEEKEKLIAVSLQEIQSACLNQSSIDWPLFAIRIGKMETFLKHFDFSQAKSLKFAGLYIEAALLLYRNGQGEIWFSKGEKFGKRIIDADRGNSKALSSVYAEYATLLDQRFGKTNDKNDQVAAFQAFDKAIGLNPKDASAYNGRGSAYQEKGETDRAIEDYTIAIDLDPEDAVAYNNRGNAYQDKSEWNRAIEDYDKAIGLDPARAAAYGNRGNAYLGRGDLDRAIDDYDKAIALDPKSADAYFSRGYAYRKKGDVGRAIDDYTKSIGFDPKRAAAYGNRGYAYLEKGELDRAIEDCDKAIGLDPKLAAAYRARGEAYKARGDMDRATADFQKSAELKPQ